jgi:hypothetical protein
MRIGISQFLDTKQTTPVVLDASFLKKTGTAQMRADGALAFAIPPQKAAYIVEQGSGTSFQKSSGSSRLKLVRERKISLDFAVKIKEGKPLLTFLILQYDRRGRRLRQLTLQHHQHGFRGLIALGSDVGSFTIALRLTGSGSIEFGAVHLRGDKREGAVDWSEAAAGFPAQPRLLSGVSRIAKGALRTEVARSLRDRVRSGTIRGANRKSEPHNDAQQNVHSGVPAGEARDSRLQRELHTLNAKLPVLGKKNPGKFLVEEIQFALRTECYETAERLAKYAQTVWVQFDSETQKQLVKPVIEASIAIGEEKTAQSFLEAHASAFAQDDRFAVLLHAARGATRSEELRLPSGRLNAFAISQNASKYKVQLQRLLASDSNAFARDAQNYLLLCNAVTGDSAAEYQRFMNRFLAMYNAGEIEAFEFSGNVLASLKFRHAPAAEGGPLVSIIMSAFNSSATIGYAIRSILDQDYRNIELLVCDDCSEDGTMQEIRTAAAGDKRLRLFRSKRNQGPYNIRNHMLSRASGDYVTFHDADDFALPSRIGMTLHNLQASHATAIVANWLRIRPSGEIVFFRDQSALRPSLVSIMAAKDVFRKYGPYRPVRFGGDTEFRERIRIAEGDAAVYQLRHPLIFGLWSASSLTQSAGSEALEDGYRGPARRQYSEITTRQRLLGSAIVPERDVMRALARDNIVLDTSSVESADGGAK